MASNAARSRIPSRDNRISRNAGPFGPAFLFFRFHQTAVASCGNLRSYPVRIRHITSTRQRTFHTCQSCGTTFFIERKATGRPPKFCSRRCRNAEFRLRRYLNIKRDETPTKSVRHSTSYKSQIGDRRSPVEVLGGGHRWSNGIGHCHRAERCPLLGVKRTWAGGNPMSAFDPKRT